MKHSSLLFKPNNELIQYLEQEAEQIVEFLAVNSHVVIEVCVAYCSILCATFALRNIKAKQFICLNLVFGFVSTTLAAITAGLHFANFHNVFPSFRIHVFNLGELHFYFTSLVGSLGLTCLVVACLDSLHREKISLYLASFYYTVGFLFLSCTLLYRNDCYNIFWDIFLVVALASSSWRYWGSKTARWCLGAAIFSFGFVCFDAASKYHRFTNPKHRHEMFHQVVIAFSHFMHMVSLVFFAKAGVEGSECTRKIDRRENFFKANPPKPPELPSWFENINFGTKSQQNNTNQESSKKKED